MNTPEKIQELLAKGHAGDVAAQNSLGCAYAQGDGVEKDYKVAFEWFMKAAQLGYKWSQYNVGLYYSSGTGCEKNLAESFRWYKKSAEQGFGPALVALAKCYEYGDGCIQDSKKAFKLYEQAADRGLKDAFVPLAQMYESGRGGELDGLMAYYWYSKAAEAGNSSGEAGLGHCYRKGIGTVKNKKKSQIWFRTAIEHGYWMTPRAKKAYLDPDYNPEVDIPIISTPIVAKNPFRILGLYSNATAKDIQANKTKINAHLSVESIPEFQTDRLMYPDSFEAATVDKESGSVPRTLELVQESISAINLPLEKLKYALFWFVNSTPIDDLALNNLLGEILSKEAEEIWLKRQNFSSYLNRGLMFLCLQDDVNALQCYQTLIHNQDLREEFLESICGETFTLDEEAFAHLFFDTVLEHFPEVDWYDMLVCREYKEDEDYVRNKLADVQIKSLQSSIDSARSVDPKNAFENLKACSELDSEARPIVLELKRIMEPDNVQYQMIMDKLANQILQNAINYFNCSDDDDAPLSAMNWCRNAEHWAVGTMVKGRCAENMATLQTIIDSLPPEKIRAAVNKIHKELKKYSEMAKAPLFEGTPGMDAYIKSSFNPRITKIAPLFTSIQNEIVQIKEALGSKSPEYIKISMEIATVALGISIENVNKVQPASDNSNPLARLINPQTIREAIEDALLVFGYIRLLNLEAKFVESRLDPNEKILKQLASRFSLSAKQVDSKIFSTEDEYYHSPLNKYGLQAFIKRYPNGVFTQNAKSKIAAIEYVEKQLASVASVKECCALFNSRKRDQLCDSLIDERCYELLKDKEKDCELYLNTFKLYTDEVKAKLKKIRKWWIALGIVDAFLLMWVVAPSILPFAILLAAVALIVLAIR